MDFAAGLIPAGVLESPHTLFFFGSKRFWLWPASEAQRQESLAQGPKYLQLDPALRELILRKEQAGQVCFLKPDVLGEPDEAVFGDYARASRWLQGAGVGPLQFLHSWWRTAWRAEEGKFCRHAESVIENFETGLHSYGPVMELLFQAGCDPVLQWPKKG